MQTVHACVSVCVSVCTCVWGIGWQLLGFLKTILELQEMRELKVSPETSAESCTFFVWPLDIVHVIGKRFVNGHDSLYVEHQSCTIWPFSDKDSPFYDLNATELSRWLLWLSSCIWRWMEIEEGVGRNFYEPMMIEVTRQRFEVVVVMEGTSETSNMTFQVFKSPPSQAS